MRASVVRPSRPEHASFAARVASCGFASDITSGVTCSLGSRLAACVRSCVTACLAFAVGAAVLTAGCGGGQVCGVAGTAACPKVFTLTHLPELVRFVTFGETRPEDVQARFAADHLHVVSSGGRDLRVQAQGPNQGRRYVYVDVTRRVEGGAPLGELGDDFALRFEFTSFEDDDDGPLLLYGVQVTQPRTATDVCASARELAAADGLSGCHELSAQPTAAPDDEGLFRACVTDEEERLVEVACVAPAHDARRLHVAVALGPPDTED